MNIIDTGEIMIIILNSILWAIATSLIVIVGLFLTVKFKGVQFHIKNIINSFKESNSNNSSTITPISSLMMVLAGRIGVGSIAGVALAIYLGGVGSIFWMWIIAFIAAASTFAETVLGNVYKEKDEDDIYKGGPAYYIHKGLKSYKLGGLYAVVVLISYIVGFIGIQSNTITKSVDSIINIPPPLVGVILALLTGIIIFKGIKGISKITSKLVPIMSIIYVGVALYVVILNIDKMPTVLTTILKEAFDLKPFFAGFMSTVIVGIQRGIFSNEAGLGTGSIASSTTADNNVIKNGYIQVIGIYITTLLICTATAFIILTSDWQTLNLIDVNGIEITQHAFTYHLGVFGNYIIFISIILFSFSTILTGYYYGESSLKYFFKNVSKELLLLLKVAAIIVIFVGCLISPTVLWGLVDIFVALLAIINMYALYRLYPKVLIEIRKYKNSKH